MRTMKQIFTTVMALLFTLMMSICVTACQEQGDKGNGKYDVTIRIACDDESMETWVFTPDVEEIRIEREYDGQEHRYYIDAYQLVDHPRWSDTWFDPYPYGANTFTSYLAYCNDVGKVSDVQSVKERGQYCLNIQADETSDFWNFRSIDLYINVY